MLLAELARTSREISTTSRRSAKVALLAALFRTLEPAEAPIAVTWLAGRLVQRRTGLGPRSLSEHVRPAAEPALTVLEVDRALERIAAKAGKGAQSARRDSLRELLGAATEQEQRFLRALIAGELRQGALEALAVEGLARALGADPQEVRRAVMLGGSLGAVARRTLDEGPRALGEFGLTVGRPVQPMLAHSAQSVTEALEQLGPCAVEEKLDGIRAQIHRDGADVAIYTRSLDDITDRLPEVVRLVRGLPGRTAVLDAEVVSLDPQGVPVAFQELAGRVGSRLDVSSASTTLPVLPVFFDLLALDDEDLLDRPLAERRQALESFVPPELLVRRLLVPDPHAEDGPDGRSAADAAEAFAAQTLAHGREGVVVKALDASYRAGRRGRSWLKVKPVHTLDLVVLAAEWGHGRRTGLLSNLHLGARAEDGTFTMLGKTFKGMTDAMLAEQTGLLGELAVERHDWGVVVRPELVVEVAFDGVQRSTRYPAGVTLRFARVLRFRRDKPAAETDRVDAVRRLLR
ncbi:ATP-dependent DNA ligase [Streptomyces sp. XM4193]|uniref:ATP-dependent DNA ligase n=1 Tax=Streptomyces sp. XM4193 TaxID=2929782 RepID=UPI001FF7EA9C|nr:ATP-dependent DNA ligase [Streptomyces sp. XM4193]MCK1797343.1 ATP-dependent DNA ligase [Streptomyces sp. XM4193]